MEVKPHPVAMIQSPSGVYITHKLLSACEYDYLSKFVVSVVLVQYAAPLVCMEARKRARLSHAEGARKNSWTIDEHGIIILEELKEEHSLWCF